MKKLLLLSIFLTLFLNLFTGVQTVNASEKKWSQPPEFLYSALQSTEREPVVADDWLCTDPRPVTDVHFWGAYKGWLNEQMDPPAESPPVIEAFMVRIYTDVPAGVDRPYSHPGGLIYEARVEQFAIQYVTSISLGDICVNCDTEHKFYYSLDLPEPFVQEIGTIYWIAISAVMPDVSCPWGWETSTMHWNDNACRYWLANAYWEELLPEMMPPWPIYERPTVDMAFALTVGEPGPPPLPAPVKWCQLPDMETGVNIISHPGPDMPTVADDWLCLDGSPVSDLHFWGSYPGWFDNDPEPPADTPTPGVKVFRIQIYSDRPAMAAGEFSRPDKLLYEVWVEDFHESYVASIPNVIPGSEFEHKYRYDLDLPRIFWQHRDRIYWLNIAAVPKQPEIPWGWENSMERWNDVAVMGWYEDPDNWDWRRIVDEYLGRYLDMSFCLTTCPGPAKWLQLPDMAKGRNIISHAGNPVVADDFLCTNGKPILEVCFWGSYLTREGMHWEEFNSGPPFQSDPPLIEAFKISFHEDIPAGVDEQMPWSHPGQLLLGQRITDYRMHYWDSIPHSGEDGLTWWEHKFYYQVDLERPFLQDKGRIYWLDIGAQMSDPVGGEFPWFWGWETSKNHWNDAAVKGDGGWWNPLGLVQIIGFEDLPLGVEYNVGDTFMASGTLCSVQPFQYSGGGWAPAGSTQAVSGSLPSGSGQKLQVNNVNVALNLQCPARELHLLFENSGGNLNLRVNGDFRNVVDFQLLDGLTVGGVMVSVTSITPDVGVLKLDGLISDFAIGGQELFIDEIGGRGGCDMAFMLITDEPLDYCEGDFYRDGDVDGADLFILCQDYNRSDCYNSGDCEGDFNYDGRVIHNDLAVFAADYGRIDCPCYIPILPR